MYKRVAESHEVFSSIFILARKYGIRSLFLCNEMVCREDSKEGKNGRIQGIGVARWFHFLFILCHTLLFTS